MPKDLSALKIALVHDDLTQYGGGERVFLAIREIFPTAAIYTSMITDEWRKRLGGQRPHTSFMQRLLFKERLERAYFPLYPLAFESFDFSDFDLVISSSSRFAHGIITRPETIHICYMHSPGRQFWEAESYFENNPRLGGLLSPVLSYLRLWDQAAAQRVDHFIANSKNTAERMAKYYGREAAVVYPFVDLDKFRQVGNRQEVKTTNYQLPTNDYYLIVTRLAAWKRVDIAVEAARQLGFRLKVVSDGPDRKRLEALAQGKKHKAKGISNVEFLGRISDEELAGLYKNCRAFIMTQKEDFGIAPLEAQAVGKPVIAYGAGGALETVVPGKTGEFFYPQTSEALVKVLKGFESRRYDPMECRKQAERFSKDVFKKRFHTQVEGLIANR